MLLACSLLRLAPHCGACFPSLLRFPCFLLLTASRKPKGRGRGKEACFPCSAREGAGTAEKQQISSFSI
uniref:hypothetical protein 26 n=1 Tax=Moniliophthora perniciosa TaxID=153609 RepID=UPI000024236B|nr:hypothetical protein 26 [Moniliophthora perniciosa]AAQ74317.1 hypothetical protein 26 [Moniliophthora perniciosa]